MLPRRSRPHQLRMLAQQLLERRDVAADDGVHRRFEVRDRRIGARQRFKMLGELRPAREAVAARDEELRVGQRAAGRTFIRLLELVPAPFDSFCLAVDLRFELRA